MIAEKTEVLQASDSRRTTRRTAGPDTHFYATSHFGRASQAQTVLQSTPAAKKARCEEENDDDGDVLIVVDDDDETIDK